MKALGCQDATIFLSTISPPSEVGNFTRAFFGIFFISFYLPPVLLP